MRVRFNLKWTVAVAALLFVGAFYNQSAMAQAVQAGGPITIPPLTADQIKDLTTQNEKNRQTDKLKTLRTKSGTTRVICPGTYQDVPTDTEYSSQTFYACRINRGNTTAILESEVIKYCSQTDGCIVRIGMHNWDDTGRVASRHFLFFYNPVSHTWRTEAGDVQGTNMNNTTEHVNNSWSCYFTDGKFANFVNQGDVDSDFALLSWNQYNADCFLTLIK